MSVRLVTAPSFVQLERELIVAPRTAGLAAFDPRWIVVPSALVANHIRSRLCVGEGVAMATQPIPMHTAVQRVCQAVGHDPGRRWGPAWDLLLLALLGELPDGHPLSGILDSTAGVGAIRRTMLDLADAGFGPFELELLDDVIPTLESPVERAALGLYERLIRHLSELSLAWRPVATRTAASELDRAALRRAMAAEVGSATHVDIYGFSEWSDVNLQFVVALARCADRATLYVPNAAGADGRPHPTFTETGAVLEDLQVRLGSDLDEVVVLDASDSPTRFFIDTFPDGATPAQSPSFLTLRRASGNHAEMIAAALKVREALDSGVDPARVLVAVPHLDRYAGALRTVFTEFAIPFRLMGYDPGLSPTASLLVALSRMWTDLAPAEWVIEVLRKHGDRIPLARDIDVDAFERKVRAAGVWGGQAWRFLLEADLDTGEAGAGTFVLTDGERHLVEGLLGLFVEGSATERLSFDAWARLLSRLRDAWVGESYGLNEVIAALGQLGAQFGRSSVKLATLIGITLELISGSLVQGQWNVRGVLVVPMGRTRALTSELTVVVGLSTDAMPSVGDEDPFFSDASRAFVSREFARVAGDIGHRLPVYASRTAVSALRFHLLSTATNALHWVVPITDDGGRQVATSPWVQRYADRWPELGRAERIPRGPLECARLLRRELGETPGAFGVLPPAMDALLTRTPHPSDPRREVVETILERLDVRRGGRPEFNGVVAPAEVRSSVQVTELELVARCPFRFFAERELRCRGLEPLGFSTSLSPRVVGTITHRLLQVALGEVCVAPYPALSTVVEGVREVLAQALPEVARRNRYKLASLPEVFRRGELDRVLHSVEAYLGAVVDGECPDGRPVRFETALSRHEHGLEIVGKADRIDKRPDGRWWLLDYKAGGLTPFQMIVRREVALGFMLQPTLYPWLAEAQAPGMGFAFIYLRGTDEVEVRGGDPDDMLGMLLGLLDNHIRVMTPTELWTAWGFEGWVRPCRTCQMSSVCRRFEPGTVPRSRGLLSALAKGRVDSIRRVARRGR